jgi:hypothetical protein
MPGRHSAAQGEKKRHAGAGDEALHHRRRVEEIEHCEARTGWGHAGDVEPTASNALSQSHAVCMRYELSAIGGTKGIRRRA